MRRRLFSLAAAVSAVLCVGVCGLWVRSYWQRGDVWYLDGVRFVSTDGGIRRWREPQSSETDWRVLGFESELDLNYNYNGTPERRETTPFWAFAATTGTLPAVCLARHLLRRRRHASRLNAGRCRWCGYDLRATPGRCPECGTVPAARKGAA